MIIFIVIIDIIFRYISLLEFKNLKFNLRKFNFKINLIDFHKWR